MIRQSRFREFGVLMKISGVFFVLTLLCASQTALASQQKTNIDPRLLIGPWQTTVSRNTEENSTVPKTIRRHTVHRRLGHLAPPSTIGARPLDLEPLRAEALQLSMKYLPRLRPYASNYRRMVQAVRTYWRDHIAHPNATNLTRTIMRHVQPGYRFFVRPKLRAGVTKGVNALKRKLRHRS